MRLQDLNWMDVERYLERDNRIILITGATEQHAYLSLLTDILVPTRIAEAVARRESLLVAPPLNFGVSYLFGEFPGTISFSQQTFEHAVLEIVESLFHQGFRHFFILNGHGGNHLPPRLMEFQIDGVIRVEWYDWWRGAAAMDFAEQHGLTIEHANWGENFPFNRVADSPEGEKRSVNIDFMHERYAVRDLLGDGSYGGPYQVEDDLMFALFDAVVEEASALVATLAPPQGS
jgi:creatinine amidohydrolase